MVQAGQWIRIFFAFSLLLFLSVNLFNVAVDPYDIFHLNALNKYRHGKGRIVNSLKLTFGRYDTLIVGTSRTEGGIDAQNSHFEGNVLNVSISGSNIYELEKVCEFIYEHQPTVKTIVYGVDFLTFSDKRYPSNQFYESLFNPDNRHREWQTLFSLVSGSTFVSTKNLINNYKHVPSTAIDGYWNKNLVGYYNYEYAFEKILTDSFLINPETYGCYEYSSERVELFKSILESGAKRKVTLKLFIPPLHYRQYVALLHLGLLDAYFHWMREVADIVNVINRKHDMRVIELYDFSGINAVTTESIPDGDKKRMKYHWESSHYTSAAGDMIVARLYGEGNGFGVCLNNVDMGEYMQKYRQAMLSYFKEHQEVVDEIGALYDQTAEIREKECRQFKNTGSDR